MSGLGRPIRLHIGHLAMRVPEPEQAASFLGEVLGLRRTLEDDGRIFLSCNEKHHEIEFLQAEQASVDHLGLEVEDEETLDHLYDAIVADGQQIVAESVDEPGLRRGFRTLTPLGVVFELYVGMEREPLSLKHFARPLARRFGHASFGCPNPEETERFLIDVLGFRVSERLLTRRWLRCDVDHHGIALFGSPQPSSFMHHYAFQLENWSTIERYCDHLAVLGRPLVWGPGRHGPGRNIYAYLVDPHNAVLEAYTDLLEIYDEASYVAMDWSDGGYAAFNAWGPEPPQGWLDYGIPAATAVTTPSD